MNPMRKPWSDLIRDVFSHVHDEFTAIRLHNQFMEEYDAIHATCKNESDFIERFLMAFEAKMPPGYEDKIDQMREVGKFLVRRVRNR